MNPYIDVRKMESAFVRDLQLDSVTIKPFLEGRAVFFCPSEGQAICVVAGNLLWFQVRRFLLTGGIH